MRSLFFSILLTALICAACNSRPDKVLSPSEMADVLIDVYKGEAMTDLSFGKFRADSSRAKMRESIYEKYGVTQEIMDSSLSYYGMHISEYVEIHDDIINRLDKESRQLGRSGRGNLNVGGDSVNVWGESSRYVLAGRSADKMLTFSIPSDENWEPGDNYTWQFKVFNKIGKAETGVYIDYDDGSTDISNGAADRDGWNRITVSLDTARVPVAIYGYAKFNVADDNVVFIDSLSLVRKRLQDDIFRRRYTQRRFNYGKQPY